MTSCPVCGGPAVPVRCHLECGGCRRVLASCAEGEPVPAPQFKPLPVRPPKPVKPRKRR